MSRIGIQPIILPEKVTALVDGNSVKINGPLGELSETLPGEIKVNLTASQLTFERKSNIPAIRALHGLSRALALANPENRSKLKSLGYLKRDPRAKERRKFGLKKARKAPKWSKR